MKDDKEKMLDIELRIGKILRFGTILSTAVMVIGLVMFVVTGHSGYNGASYPHNFQAIVMGLAGFKPFAWLMAGLFLLILTPVLRVLASIFAFAKERDRMYVVITLIVLLILIVAILLGHAGE
ncbi:DUF1634 domain-containing protein [Lactococcus termiticola]|uniref:Membrane protein n=1 Tax=Lactococcus termiticola TaxID=2169526 RepID=A0A2R5HHN4_9LACT|nr:DUF1634 domain-containing protein [Lactococcus termiticola]GBG97492.1 membrane protein [Lactococcus termiticola]